MSVGPLPRADHMGGLLRPSMVQDLRDRGIFDEELELVEDMAVRDIVAIHRAAGLRALTDGAVRRTSLAGDFLAGLTGVAPENHSGGIRVDAALAFPAEHAFLRHFRFLRSLIFRHDEWPKATLPGPQLLAQALSHGRLAYSPYQDRDLLEQDIVASCNQAMTALHALGCRHLQVTDRALTGTRADAGAAQRDAGRQAGLIATILAARPAGMTVALCLPDAPLEPRSDVFWEQMFQISSVDLFLVPASAEAPDCYAPLRHLPKGKGRVLLGLVAAQSPRFETVSRLTKSVDAAARHADPDQLGLALLPAPGQAGPGFRDADHQFRKLRLLAEATREIWGAT
jgi:5-methyltetrahydropteroyltriglutamate--homocysteine methyltransferase